MSDFASIIGGSGVQIDLTSDTLAGLEPYAIAYDVSSGDDWFVDMGAEGDMWAGQTSTGDTTVLGGTGDDTIANGSGDDVASGQDGNDALYTQGGNDTAAGGAGNDTIDTDGGDSNIGAGGSGDDAMYGGAGTDLLAGGSDDDVIHGGDGADQLFGQSGDDTLFGDGGDDRLFGQSGNDHLWGGAGNDSLYGGDGSDTFYFDSNFGNDVINDFNGGAGDTIWLKAGINGTGISSPDDLLSYVSGTATQTVITIGSDTITISGVSVDAFKASIADWVKVS